MSAPTPAQVAEFDQCAAGHSERLDNLIDMFRRNPTGLTDSENVVVLARMLSFTESLTRLDVADLAALAIRRLATQVDPERYRLAWQQARRRAADHLAALVESDAERDHLAVQLRERDEDVRDLANRLAEFCGITS